MLVFQDFTIFLNAVGRTLDTWLSRLDTWLSRLDTKVSRVDTWLSKPGFLVLMVWHRWKYGGMAQVEIWYGTGGNMVEL